jgi:hypothetical protein
MRWIAPFSGFALLLAAPLGAQQSSVTLPAGSELAVRMQSGVSSETSFVGDGLSAAVQSAADPYGNPISLPWPVALQGHLAAVASSAGPDVLATVTLHFDQLVVQGWGVSVHASLATYVPEGDSWRITTVDGGTVIIDRLRFFPALRGVLLELSGGTAFAGVAEYPPNMLVAPAPDHAIGIPAGTVFAVKVDQTVTLSPQP